MKKIKFVSRMNQSLRGQLSLWYLGSITLIITIFLIATGSLFWITLQNQIDHHVHIVVNEAAQIVQQFSAQQRQQLLTNLVSAKGMTVILLSPDGSPILETNNPDIAAVTEHQLQSILSSNLLNNLTPDHFTINGIRFAATPVNINAGKGILAVGYSTQVIYSTLTKLLLIIGAIIIFCVIPLTYLGYKLLKKQLQPLESITLQTQKINTSQSLSHRIHLRQPTKELITIQNTLNQMLAKLEAVFTKERAFFSDAAHTLKTPLAILRSQLENLDIAAHTKNNLLKVIDSTSGTIQDLLFLSKIGSSNQKKTTFSLSKLMEDLVEITTTLGESKNITVNSKIAQNIQVTANKKQLLRALSNVALNAVIYNHPRGAITISMKQDQKRIVIKISDTGRGVAQKHIPKIFDRFYQCSTSHKWSSGLGLAITKAVIEDLGGKVAFRSKVGTGSTVSIILPAAKK